MDPGEICDCTTEQAAAWLAENGYDGLYNEHHGCACLGSDIAPCGAMELECTAGHVSPCNGMCDSGHCDFHVGECDDLDS